MDVLTECRERVDASSSWLSERRGRVAAPLWLTERRGRVDARRPGSQMWTTERRGLRRNSVVVVVVIVSSRGNITCSRHPKTSKVVDTSSTLRRHPPDVTLPWSINIIVVERHTPPRHRRMPACHRTGGPASLSRRRGDLEWEKPPHLSQLEQVSDGPRPKGEGVETTPSVSGYDQAGWRKEGEGDVRVGGGEVSLRQPVSP